MFRWSARTRRGTTPLFCLCLVSASCLTTPEQQEAGRSVPVNVVVRSVTDAPNGTKAIVVDGGGQTHELYSNSCSAFPAGVGQSITLLVAPSPSWPYSRFADLSIARYPCRLWLVSMTSAPSL